MYKLKETQKFCDQDLKSTILYKDSTISIGRCPQLYIHNLNTKETTTVETNFSGFSSAFIFGDKLILGSQTGTILIYNDILTNSAPLFLTGHTQCVCSLDVYDHFLLSSSWDGTIRLWDLLNYRLINVFDVNVCVWQARFFKNQIGDYKNIDFYAACADKTVTLYRNKEVDKKFVYHLTAVRGVFVCMDSVYSIGNDGKLMKSTIDGKLTKVVDLKDFLYCLKVEDDKIYVCGENGLVVVLSLDLKVLCRIKCKAQSCWNVHLINSHLYVSCSEGKMIVLEEGVEDKPKEDQTSHKLKDKNYKVENGKAYYLVNDQWTLVGDVVEKKYDHTFSVEVDGRYLNINFNESDDVYDVADKFLHENNLDKNYRDEIVEFIKNNFTPKQAYFMYKDINMDGIRKYLKDEFVLENLKNPNNKNSEEVDKRLKGLLNEEVNFYVLDCYRYLYYNDYDFDFCFLQDYKIVDKKAGTVFLRLVCNMYSNMPFNTAILQKKINKIIDTKLADEKTISNYVKNKHISEK